MPVPSCSLLECDNRERKEKEKATEMFRMDRGMLLDCFIRCRNITISNTVKIYQFFPMFFDLRRWIVYPSVNGAVLYWMDDSAVFFVGSIEMA